MTDSHSTMNYDKKVFISYSHRDKRVADEVDESLRSHNLIVHRDIRDVSYRESFSKFMKRVRVSDFVLVVISDHFLKSEYCMFEVSEFIKDHNYDSRILPVVLESAKIYHIKDVVEYIKFWKLKYKELQTAVNGLSLEELSLVSKSAVRFKEFSMILGNFIEQIKDLNHKSYDELKKDGFRDILELIGIEKVSDEIPLIAHEGQEVFNEGRLIFLGNGGVGKTSLIRQMAYQTFEPDSKTTEGVDITSLSLKTDASNRFVLNCWDFGGQEIYHAAHQFFLTRNALYILVLDARSEASAASTDYWLKSIIMATRDAPVIIVINKIDERDYNLDQKNLLSKFPNVVAIQKTSALTKAGINELKNTISKYVKKLEIIGHSYPSSWNVLRHELERLNKPFISNAEFLGLCNRLNIDQNQAELASRYFNDLGIIIHFSNNYLLRDMIILKPTWLTSALYKILDSRVVRENNGTISFDDISDIWAEYPEEKHPHLLEFLKRFELCFQLPNSTEYIIPELLSIDAPDLPWHPKEYMEYIRFQYRYSMMPSGIIPRLIVRTHDIIKSNVFWKSGVLMQSGNSEALIVCNTTENNLSVLVKGKTAMGLLMMIRREVDIIHSFFQNIGYKEMVACTCNECKTLSQPEYYEYTVLLKYHTKGKYAITCPISIEDVEIQSILQPILGTSKGNNQDVIQILDKLRDKNESEESLLKKANDIILLQPNFFGIGININELIKRVLKKG